MYLSLCVDQEAFRSMDNWLIFRQSTDEKVIRKFSLFWLHSIVFILVRLQKWLQRIGRSKRVKRKTYRQFTDDDNRSSSEEILATLMSETLLLLIQCQWSLTIIMLVDAMTNDDDKYCPGKFRGLNGSVWWRDRRWRLSALVPGTPVIPSCSGTPGVIFYRSARKMDL